MKLNRTELNWIKHSRSIIVLTYETSNDDSLYQWSVWWQSNSKIKKIKKSHLPFNWPTDRPTNRRQHNLVEPKWNWMWNIQLKLLEHTLNESRPTNCMKRKWNKKNWHNKDWNHQRKESQTKKLAHARFF